VLDHDGTTTTCAARLDHDHPYRTEDGTVGLLAVELMAQVTAVHAALLCGDATPRSGMLVGVQRVALHVSHLPDDATVSATQTWGDDGRIAAFTAEVRAGDTSIATGELRVVRESKTGDPT
jgi:predicted hotdog family 3-hydroxylacyl-ACP dehydratase